VGVGGRGGEGSVLAVVTEGEIKQGMEERYAKKTKERENDRKLNTDSRRKKERWKEKTNKDGK